MAAAAVQRPDGIYSWVVAVACFWVTFVTQGLVRCGGVVYVYVIDIYKVGRGPASWPFILRLTIWNLSGPIAGALSYRWSIRTITFFGVIGVALGNALCWFASDITAVTVFFGLLQGLGLGMVMTLVPVIINQYFVKYKTTGAGIACADGTAGSFALPPVVELAIEEYGLQGAFLMMAGITLQGVLGAALMRPAPWLKKNKPIAGKTEAIVATNSDKKSTATNGVNGKCMKDINQNPCNGREVMLSKAENGCSRSLAQKIAKTVRFSSKLQVNEDTGENEDPNEMANLLNTPNNIQIIANGSRTTESALQDSDTEQTSPHTSVQIGNGVLKFIDDDDDDTNHKDAESHNESAHAKNQYQLVETNENDGHQNGSAKKSEKTAGPLRNAWTIVKDAMFLVTAINYSIFFLSYMTYLIVIVDYSFDLGIDKTSSVFLVSAFSIADLCGRLGSGWITDSGLVKRRNMMVCNMVILAFFLAGTAFAKTYVAVLAMSVATGVVVGMNLILFYALLEQYLGLQHMAMAVGLMNFMIGCISLVTPSLTGFFRDTLGSYDHLFHFLGVCLFLCALLWAIEPFYLTRKEKLMNEKLDQK